MTEPTETDAMLNDCYAIGLTPEASARLIQLVDDLYTNDIVADSFPTKREYLQTMLATQKVPKGIPTATDIAAAQMQLDRKQKRFNTTFAQALREVGPLEKPKFSDTIKATIK